MLAGFPDLLSAGYAVDAEQELAEAEILASCTCGKEAPSPEEIGVEDEAFVLGMADSIGEMRRLLLDRLMKDDVEAAGLMLGKMERFFNILMTFDYPDALIATKRKQDVARGLVEKSRGELAMATQMSRLRKNLD
jgi:translin